MIPGAHRVPGVRRAVPTRGVRKTLGRSRRAGKILGSNKRVVTTLGTNKTEVKTLGSSRREGKMLGSSSKTGVTPGPIPGASHLCTILEEQGLATRKEEGGHVHLDGDIS
mmetsp:Transcript_21430/g.38259  ORF Transcript_21430/g.38259 Transcript_21430/m.38259 type:complete len:110 (-) Transcript_21430:182-511(-)